MQQLKHFIKKHRLLVCIVAGLLIAYGIMVTVLYFTDDDTFKGKTTYSTISVENLTVEQAYDKLQNAIAGIPVTITADGSSLQANAESLGTEIDINLLIKDIKQQKIRYALLPFLYKKEYKLPLITNTDRFIPTIRSIELPDGKKPPVDASVDYVNNEIIVLPESEGDGLDASVITAELQKQISEGANTITIATNLTAVSPRVTAKALADRKQAIATILQTTFTITDGKNTIVITPNALAKSLYIDENNQLQPTYAAAAKIVSEASQMYFVAPTTQLEYSFTSGKQNEVFQKGAIGSAVSNEPELIEQLRTGVLSAQPTILTVTMVDIPFTTRTFVIEDAAKKEITYTIETWGKIQSSIAEFREKAADTLLNEKGWSRAGITFKEVQKNPDFYLVLSEGAELSRRYSPTCDAYYSCNVGNYVIINDARWQNATPVWPKDIGAYQNLVINHETGHWLGLGHYFCTAAGAPAPVMQQQSINIRNCTFNEWPLDYEIDKL